MSDSLIQISGISALQGKFSGLVPRYGSGTEKPSVTVGFTQYYAIYVHENMNARHAVGNAKYLENPARRLASELGNIIHRALNAGSTLVEGLLIAGLRLQREAQLEVPVDTSALKASAFTSLTEKEEAASLRAYMEGERVRARSLIDRIKRSVRMNSNNKEWGKTMTRHVRKTRDTRIARAQNQLRRAR